MEPLSKESLRTAALDARKAFVRTLSDGERALLEERLARHLTSLCAEAKVVGGYAPDRVALRRAIALAYDGEQEIEQVRHGQAIPAQAIVPPLVSGYDAKLKTEMSDHDRARAKATGPVLEATGRLLATCPPGSPGRSPPPW
jgi:hypothetical protein